MIGSEVSVSGGPAVLVLVAIALAITTIVVGAWVGFAAYRGYRQSGDRSIYFLAVGITLATAGHTTARVLLSTLNAPLLYVNAIAIAVQFTGLVFVLYAVYGNPDRDSRVVALSAILGGILVLLLPLGMARNGTVSSVTAGTVANSITATLGAFIAIQAFRGYHRYERPPMLLLGVGIGLLTVGSFVLLNLPVSILSDAFRIGLVLTIEFVGLLSVALSLHIE